MPIAAAAMSSSSSKNPHLAKLIEEAMGAAASKAIAEGITDPNEIRARMLEARELVKNGGVAPKPTKKAAAKVKSNG